MAATIFLKNKILNHSQGKTNDTQTFLIYIHVATKSEKIFKDF